MLVDAQAFAHAPMQTSTKEDDDYEVIDHTDVQEDWVAVPPDRSTLQTRKDATHAQVIKFHLIIWTPCQSWCPITDTEWPEDK